MSALIARRIFASRSFTTPLVRAASNVPYHNDKRSSAPLIEHYRSQWPDANPDKPVETRVDIPERTISDDVLRFSFKTSLHEGQQFFYPHLQCNPADLKVSMKVFLADLNLDRIELQIFVHMVGKRLRVGNGELKLTCNKFPNKEENRKYLVYQLEELVAASRRLAKMENKFVPKVPRVRGVPADLDAPAANS